MFICLRHRSLSDDMFVADFDRPSAGSFFSSAGPCALLPQDAFTECTDRPGVNWNPKDSSASRLLAPTNVTNPPNTDLAIDESGLVSLQSHLVGYVFLESWHPDTARRHRFSQANGQVECWIVQVQREEGDVDRVLNDTCLFVFKSLLPREKPRSRLFIGGNQKKQSQVGDGRSCGFCIGRLRRVG
jgi:hypothetical protein